MIKCKDCDTEYEIVPEYSAYIGEIVLQCPKCGALYFNAQEFFYESDLEKLKIRKQ